MRMAVCACADERDGQQGGQAGVKGVAHACRCKHVRQQREGMHGERQGVAPRQAGWTAQQPLGASAA
jgi:hypothetical protein